MMQGRMDGTFGADDAGRMVVFVYSEFGNLEEVFCALQESFRAHVALNGIGADQRLLSVKGILRAQGLKEWYLECGDSGTRSKQRCQKSLTHCKNSRGG
jgi:hypothetical protein